MTNAVIVAGVRTPFVKAGGPLGDVSAVELGRWAVRELLERCNLRPDTVDELIAGNVACPTDAANIARVVALRAGIPQDRIAHTVSRNCASGMESLTEAITLIEHGRARCIVAVGVDSMSNIPMFWKKSLAEKVWNLSRAKGVLAKLRAAGAIRPADLQPIIGIQSGLTDPVSGLMMGETAEKLAREFGISREEQDNFALESHRRAIAAEQAGRLSDEVMTVYPASEFEPISQDIGPRAGQTFEALQKLKPYFDRKWGTVTVGNACQVTDGGVAMLVTSEDFADEMGLQPQGRVRGYAYAGCDPARMGLGPVYASGKALTEAGLTMSDMELVELNEAFAAQVLACQKCFAEPSLHCSVSTGRDRLSSIPPDRLNVNGGAIAVGHPVGATGSRLVLTLLGELHRRKQKVGLATLCVGGGQGAAVVVETIS